MSNEKAPALTRKESRRVDEIVELWLDYQETIDFIETIAEESPTLLQKLVEHEGELPQGSGYYPDTMAKKVDFLRGRRITHEQRDAKETLFELPLYDREYITLWRQIKNKPNPQTGEIFTRLDLFKCFGCSERTYKARASAAKRKLLAIDRRKNPHLYREPKKALDACP